MQLSSQAQVLKICPPQGEFHPPFSPPSEMGAELHFCFAPTLAMGMVQGTCGRVLVRLPKLENENTFSCNTYIELVG